MEQALKKIIFQCRKNDRKAQFDLYQFSFDHLLRIGLRYKNNREDAVALLNEAFLKILNALDRYELDRPFLPWAATIMLRTAIDDYRQQRPPGETVALQDSSGEDRPLNSAEANAIDQMSAQEIRSMIAQLKLDERMVFVLYELEGFSHKEIAGQLGVSERSSKRYLKRAKEQLREKLRSARHYKEVS